MQLVNTERRAFPRYVMNVDAMVRFGAEFFGHVRFLNASVEGLFAEGDYSISRPRPAACASGAPIATWNSK